MKINILVTGSGSLIGQAIIKSIKASKYKDNVNLIGADYFSDTVGSYWCEKNYQLPDFYKNSELKSEWTKALTDIIKKENIQFVFVGVDFELPLFAEHKNTFEKINNCHILINPEEVIRISNDKYQTFKFLKENGFSHPKTSWLNQESISSNTDFPVIVKPAVGARSRDVFVVKNREKLSKLALQEKGFILQELIGNDQSEFTCGVLRLDGQFIACIPLNRELKNGNTFKAFYEEQPHNVVIVNYLKKLTTALNVNGACNFQLRLDKNGTPKLFEINARHSGTTFIRTFFGYNEIEMILSFYLTGKVEQPVLKEGMVMRYFTEEFFNLKKK